jgi:hypothetical protein
VRLRGRLLLIVFFAGLLTAPASGITFKNPPIIPTAGDPLGVATADLNHDGKLDLIYVNGANPIVVHTLLGRGDGTFAHGQDISMPAGVCGSLNCAITIADVNGDGNLDVILGGAHVNFQAETSTPQVVVLLGYGDGTFQPAIVSSFQPPNLPYTSVTQPFAVGDVNEDGLADLVTSDGTYVYVLYGDGTGHFTLGNEIETNTTGPTYLADLNGDHHLDIVTMDRIGAIFYVLLGNGNATFQQFVRYATGAPTNSMLLTDLDGDGHPDVVAQIYPNLLILMKGNPDGTFAAPTTIDAQPPSGAFTAVEDFNGDGIKDFLYYTPAGVGVLLGESNLNFGSFLQSISGNSNVFETALTISVGDFNGDGHSDIAMAAEGGIVILLGNGDGTFKSADLYDVGQLVGAAAVADFNGDKLPDIAVTLPANFPRLLLGDGNGGFTLGPDPNPSYGSQSPFSNLEVADFNGDGKKDLTMGNQVPNTASSGTQYVELGSGNGTFSSPVAVANGAPVLADFSNDGRTDMIADGGDSIIVSLGQADGNFLTVTTPLRVPSLNGWLAVGDVNRDGKPDVVINYRDHIEIWLGNGDGSFSFLGSIAGINGIMDGGVAAVTDVDGDGNGDIVLGPSSSLSAVVIFYGNGDGTFQAPILLPVSHLYTQITVVDVNQDKLPDLVMSNGASIAVLMNLGGRKFDSEVDFVAGTSISYLNVVDVNGDGYPDIVVANPGGTTVAVLLNQPKGMSAEGASVNGTFTTSPNPSGFGHPIIFRLTLSGSDTGSAIPTGSVNFAVDGGSVATVPLVSGIASYTLVETLDPAPHTVTATYSGDNLYASRSFSVVQTVQPPIYPTSTSLKANPVSTVASQTVRLMATVTSSPIPPAGIVTFFDGPNTLGSSSIDFSGNVNFDTALLAPGTHPITATYEGYSQVAAPDFCGCTTEIFAASTSAAVTVSVSASATTTTVSASSMLPTAGTVVTFTASVGSGAGVPIGGVTFYDGAVNLGTTSLKADGSTEFSIASLGIGSHSISATYYSNGMFNVSTSAVLSVSVVAAAAISIPTVISLSAQTNPAGGSTTLSAIVHADNGSPAGTVIFLDSGIVLGSTATGDSGAATFPISMLSIGNHNLSASFAGTSNFSPSASPELLEQWPAGGPGFSLGIAAKVSPGIDDSSNSFLISVVPDAGFDQVIQLSCVGNLPFGSRCVFSAPSIKTGGTSYLLIQSSTKAVGIRTPTKRWFGALPGVLALLLFLYSFTRSLSHHRVRVLASLLACLSFSILTGCGSSSSSGGASQMFVVSIHASSGTSAGTIVHTTQVAVSFPHLN